MLPLAFFSKQKTTELSCALVIDKTQTLRHKTLRQDSFLTFCSFQFTFSSEVVAGRQVWVVAHLHRVETQILLRGVCEGEERPDGQIEKQTDIPR